MIARVVLGFLLILGSCSQQSSLRSYHPHYLHSRSYPTPSTLHYYYGRVEGTTPIFLIQKGFEGIESDLFVMDHQEDHPQTKIRNLRMEGEEPLRTMLVFSIEDSYEDNYTQTARMERVTGKYCYGLLLNNKTYTKAFIVRYTRDYEMIELSDAEKDITTTWRNVSVSPKNTWRLSRQISWFETQKDKPMPSNFEVTDFQNLTAVALQFTIDQRLLGTLRVHIDEVPLAEHITILESKEIFDILLSQFDHGSPIEVKKPEELTCQSDAIDRLKRGLSFEYGRLHLVHGQTPIQNAPQGLLSFSPSRKRFPWGFLWDDGFHNEVVVRSEPDLVIKVLKSWLDTEISGWIPREQDRGEERQELCNCPNFLVKDDRDGNPPSLVLALGYLLKNKKLSLETLGQKSWNQLKQWHAWYMRTQMIGEKTYLFKWFDHIQSNGSFNSGLDDFPRPVNGLYHIDAQSWMYEITKFMWEASLEFKDADAVIYQEQKNKILEGVQNFIEPETNLFKDVGSSKDIFSEHLGYPSLLPLAFGMVKKNSPQYFSTLESLSNRTVFNTLYGISSISQSSPLYLATRDAYWRGPVWINLNYLVLRGLKLYYPEQQELYSEIRQQLINTVCGEWKRTGFFFENYIKGVGSFSYPFNGWTSLIALIISESF